MAEQFPKFRDSLDIEPRNGWNYTIGGKKIERESFEELVQACRNYAKSKGKSTKGLKQAITEHICEENPWMCRWVPKKPTPKEEIKPRESIDDFMEWLQRNIIEYTDYSTAKKRTNICLKCPYNQRGNTFSTQNRRAWGKFPPHIKLNYCTHHHHDNAVAVHIANLTSPNDTPPENPECWVPNMKEVKA